ncbi:MAG: oxidoreductase, partial [Actinobacteria bacterium]|nr:oxidoreductase [Actinomycetota bacterium]
MDGSRAEPQTDGRADRSTTGSAVVSEGIRSQLTVGEDVIDTSTWAGSIPQVGGTAPHVRMPGGRWFNLLWLVPIGFVGLIVAVP